MSETDTTSQTEGINLCDIDVGDEIETSVRDTPMSVTKVKKTRSGEGTRVIAKNRHSIYELVQYGSQPGSLRVIAEGKVFYAIEVRYAN